MIDNRPIRIGVVGLRHGARHVRGFQQAIGSTVTAVSDLDPTRAHAMLNDAAPGCAVVTCDELIADERIDAVVVSVPNNVHVAVAEQALRAGKHVAVEKPMATTAAQAERLVRLAAERGLVLAALHDFRADQAHFAARELVRAGELGDVYSARTVWLRRDNAPSSPWYLDRARSGGGVLMDLGTHRIDQVLWMLNFPTVEVLTAVMSRRLLECRDDDDGGDVEDTASGTLLLDGGVVVQVETSFMGHLPRAEEVVLELRGTRAGLRVDNVGDSYRDYRLTMFRGQDGTHEQITFPALPAPPCIYEDFATAVRTATAPLCPGTQAATVAAVIERMYAAAAGMS